MGSHEVKLTGHESSVLAFLAQRPAAFEEMKKYLGGEALSIGKYLAGIDAATASPDVRATGEYIQRWAAERRVREAEEGWKSESR